MYYDARIQERQANVRSLIILLNSQKN